MKLFEGLIKNSEQVTRPFEQLIKNSKRVSKPFEWLIKEFWMGDLNIWTAHEIFKWTVTNSL